MVFRLQRMEADRSGARPEPGSKRFIGPAGAKTGCATEGRTRDRNCQGRREMESLGELQLPDCLFPSWFWRFRLRSEGASSSRVWYKPQALRRSAHWPLRSLSLRWLSYRLHSFEISPSGGLYRPAANRCTKHSRSLSCLELLRVGSCCMDNGFSRAMPRSAGQHVITSSQRFKIPALTGRCRSGVSQHPPMPRFPITVHASGFTWPKTPPTGDWRAIRPHPVCRMTSNNKPSPPHETAVSGSHVKSGRRTSTG